MDPPCAKKHMGLNSMMLLSWHCFQSQYQGFLCNQDFLFLFFSHRHALFFLIGILLCRKKTLRICCFHWESCLSSIIWEQRTENFGSWGYLRNMETKIHSLVHPTLVALFLWAASPASTQHDLCGPYWPQLSILHLKYWDYRKTTNQQIANTLFEPNFLEIICNWWGYQFLKSSKSVWESG